MVRWMLVLFNPLATWEDDPKTHIFIKYVHNIYFQPGVKPAAGFPMGLFISIYCFI